MKKITGLVVIVSVLLGCLSQGAFAAETGKKLFVNLSSDEINRAAMAINFSTRVLKQKKIPVTIFLNVEGVRIADKNLPHHKHINGQSTQEMLQAFIDAGGKVIICPMCMKNVGRLTPEDILDGVVVGGSDVTWPALFADDVRVLSY